MDKLTNWLFFNKFKIESSLFVLSLPFSLSLSIYLSLYRYLKKLLLIFIKFVSSNYEYRHRKKFQVFSSRISRYLSSCSTWKTLISFPRIYASVCKIDRILNETADSNSRIQKAGLYYLSLRLTAEKHIVEIPCIYLHTLCELMPVNARFFSWSLFRHLSDGKRSTRKIFHSPCSDVEYHALINRMKFALSRSYKKKKLELFPRQRERYHLLSR